MGNLARKFIEEGEARGEAKGEARGKLEGKLEVAQSMLEAGSDTAFIVKVTGLSKEEIDKLK